MNQNKVLSLVGLAAKAGKVVSGEFSTEKAVKTGQAFLVLVSEEASGNTRKKFQNMCAYKEVPIVVYGAKEAIGRAMGKEMRASLAILDQGLADAIKKQLSVENNGGSKYVED